MQVRARTQLWESEKLSPYASLSAKSKGRVRFQEECPLRTVYQRDRDRITHSKAFRRLKHKTQVFLSPEGDHYRTRLTHTLEVSQIARTIARALLLNEDLTEAIALGHDLGHTPFGHAGERALDALSPDGFRHYEQSVRVVEKLEDLNLTYEVKNGILCHTKGKQADTLEGQVVRIADRIGYINHDIDDAIRAGVITESDIPKELTQVLGNTTSKRINTLVTVIASFPAVSVGVPGSRRPRTSRSSPPSKVSVVSQEKIGVPSQVWRIRTRTVSSVSVTETVSHSISSSSITR